MKKKSKKSSLDSFTLQRVLSWIVFIVVAGLSFNLLSGDRQKPDINEIVLPNTVVVNLFFHPIATINRSNNAYAVDLMLDTRNNLVTAAQIEISYDPLSLTNMTITQGNFLLEKIGSTQMTNGKVKFVYTIPFATRGVTGVGKVATLNFKILQNNSTINFTDNTIVTVKGYSRNSINSARGMIINTPQETRELASANPSVDPAMSPSASDSNLTVDPTLPEKISSETEGQKPWYSKLITSIKSLFSRIYIFLFQ